MEFTAISLNVGFTDGSVTSIVEFLDSNNTNLLNASKALHQDYLSQHPEYQHIFANASKLERNFKENRLSVTFDRKLIDRLFDVDDQQFNNQHQYIQMCQNKFDAMVSNQESLNYYFRKAHVNSKSELDNIIQDLFRFDFICHELIKQHFTKEQLHQMHDEAENMSTGKIEKILYSINQRYFGESFCQDKAFFLQELTPSSVQFLRSSLDNTEYELYTNQKELVAIIIPKNWRNIFSSIRVRDDLLEEDDTLLSNEFLLLELTDSSTTIYLNSVHFSAKKRENANHNQPKKNREDQLLSYNKFLEQMTASFAQDDMERNLFLVFGCDFNQETMSVSKDSSLNHCSIISATQKVPTIDVATCRKQRSFLQVQWNKAHVLDEGSKDGIGVVGKQGIMILDYKVGYLSGSYLENPRDKREGNSSDVLIPNGFHPYDHFAVIAAIKIETLG